MHFSMPLAHALAEDYLLEELAPAKTRFTYRVAIEPRLAVAMGGPISRMYFGSMAEVCPKAGNANTCPHPVIFAAARQRPSIRGLAIR